MMIVGKEGRNSQSVTPSSLPARSHFLSFSQSLVQKEGEVRPFNPHSSSQTTLKLLIFKKTKYHT